jgi:hypothetical protein
MKYQSIGVEFKMRLPPSFWRKTASAPWVLLRWSIFWFFLMGMIWFGYGFLDFSLVFHVTPAILG